MTGFGQAEGPVGPLRVLVDVRTVNHRFFSPSIKLPGSLARWESEVREALRQKVSRGHVTLTIRTERHAEATIGIDAARFAAAARQLQMLAEQHGLAGGVDVATVLRMPDVLSSPKEDDEAGSVSELVSVVSQALAALDRSRAEEGARLADILLQRLNLIDASLARISARAPERIVAHRDRLRAAVKELADGVAVDEARLAQEIAILADRMDVAEELDRFSAHIAAFRATLADAGESRWASDWVFSSRRCFGKPIPRVARQPMRRSCTKWWR